MRIEHIFGGALQRFWGEGVEILIKYSSQAIPSLRKERNKGLNTCTGKEMGCFKKVIKKKIIN